MKKFWKLTLVPGLCCILAGAVLAVILALGYSDDLIRYQDEFSINEDNFWEFFEYDEFASVTREGRKYDQADTQESYQYEVPDGEVITGLDFEFAVGEVEIKTGDNMNLLVTDMFENAISAKVVNGIWYIEDSLIDSGKVHSEYSPKISITISKTTAFESIKIYLAAGLLEAEELLAKEVALEVDAGSLKVYELDAVNALELTNGVGEIKVYDGEARNLTVDNGIGAIAINGSITGHNEIKCGIGEVKLSLTDRGSVDFNYSVDCGIGEVEIGGKSFTGSVESNSYDHENADYFALDCGIGHIEINVNGN